MLFASYQAEIERQFEHVLINWLGSEEFSPAVDTEPPARAPGSDPMVGDLLAPKSGRVLGLSIPDSLGGGEAKLAFERFVKIRGAVYFFAPSIATLRAIAEGIEPPDWPGRPALIEETSND